MLAWSQGRDFWTSVIKVMNPDWSLIAIGKQWVILTSSSWVTTYLLCTSAFSTRTYTFFVISIESWSGILNSKAGLKAHTNYCIQIMALLI